jgi:hypothetical protein
MTLRTTSRLTMFSISSHVSASSFGDPTARVSHVRAIDARDRAFTARVARALVVDAHVVAVR